MSTPLRSSLGCRIPVRTGLALALTAVAALPLISAEDAASAPSATTAIPGAPVIDLREFQRQRLELLLEGSQRSLNPAQRTTVAREFLNHLRRTSKLTLERVERGEIDDDEL